MIVGRVNAKQQSLIQITIRGPQGQEQTFEARIDSGFNGGLTLPPEIVTTLGLSTDRTDFVVLANGEQIRLTTYETTLILDGNEQTVPVFATGDFPLLEMLPLQGYRICLDMVEGGAVTLIPLSQVQASA